MGGAERGAGEVAELRCAGQVGELAPPCAEPGEQGPGLEPQEGQTGFHGQRVDVV